MLPFNLLSEELDSSRVAGEVYGGEWEAGEKKPNHFTKSIHIDGKQGHFKGVEVNDKDKQN